MAETNAFGRVAMMANKQAGRDRTVRQLPRETMSAVILACSSGLFRFCKTAVFVVVRSLFPDPTFSNDLDVPPESDLCRNRRGRAYSLVCVTLDVMPPKIPRMFLRQWVDRVSATAGAKRRYDGVGHVVRASNALYLASTGGGDSTRSRCALPLYPIQNLGCHIEMLDGQTGRVTLWKATR